MSYYSLTSILKEKIAGSNLLVSGTNLLVSGTNLLSNWVTDSNLLESGARLLSNQISRNCVFSLQFEIPISRDKWGNTFKKVFRVSYYSLKSILKGKKAGSNLLISGTNLLSNRVTDSNLLVSGARLLYSVTKYQEIAFLASIFSLKSRFWGISEMIH